MDVVQGLKEPIHPLYERSIEIIDEYFLQVLDEQQLLNDDKGKNLLKGLIKAYFGLDYNRMEEEIDKILDRKENSVSTIKLTEIEAYLKKNEKSQNQNQKSTHKKKTTTDLCICDFKLNVLYPRLDINVSTHINHLLKSPFCIHPKTGLVAVPLPPNDILNFEIEKIPRLDKLVEDFKNNRKNENFEKYTKYFRDFVEKLKLKKCN